MTFKLELSDNNIFKIVFESVSRIIDEVTLIADNDGLRFSALDKSHITFVTLDLKASLFDMYQCDVPEKICIDCNEFMKIIKKCKTTDILGLNIAEDNLIITMAGDALRKFKLRLIDNEYEPQTPPDITHDSNIMVPSNILADALSDMELFDESVTFKIDQDYFIISANGEFGDANTKYLHGENIIKSVNAGFTISKLADIMKSSKFSESVELMMGDDLPLNLTFRLSTGDGVLTYLLAPRINDSE